MDYFNKEERVFQEHFKVIRDRAFSNVCFYLHKIGITPNMVSIMGVVFLVSIIWIPRNLFWLSGIFLTLYLLMDGIDGPLARLTLKSHKGGAIVDIFCDQLGIVIVPIASIIHLNIQPVSALLFSTGYIILIVIVVFENELLKYSARKFVRIKYIIYVLYIVSIAINYAFLLNYTFVIGAVYYWSESIARVFSLYTHYEKYKVSE